MKKLALVAALILAVGFLGTANAIACDMHAKGEKKDHAEHSAKSGEKHGDSCNMKAADAKTVELTGKILCKHCDLKQSDKCAKVFQTASDQKIYDICKGSKVDVAKLGESKSSLKVTGKLVKCGETGAEELMIEEASAI